jgi:tetratricopeptide (TPR) repeat protein
VKADRALAVARHHLDTGKPQRALDVLGSCTEFDALGVDGWIARASALYLLDRPDDAVAAARQGLTYQPSSTLLDIIGLAYLELGRTAESLEVFESAQAIFPGAALIMCHRALALAVLGRRREARELADHAGELSPLSEPVLEARISLALALRDADRAEELSGALLALDPENALAHRIQASSLGDRLSAGEARHHLEMAIRVEPGHPDVPDLVGKVYVASHPLAAPLRLHRRHPRVIAAVWLACWVGVGVLAGFVPWLDSAAFFVLMAFLLAWAALLIVRRRKVRRLR